MLEQKKFAVLLAIVVLLVVLSSSASSQPTETPGGIAEETDQSVLSEENNALREENLQLRELVETLNDRIDHLELSIQHELALERARFAIAHERRVFWWQLIVSYIFSAVVFSMIVLGFWLSWLQFRRGQLISLDLSTKALSSEIEISAEKVRIQTSLVGVLILCIAFGFTVVFLNQVYDISYASPSET